MRNYVIINGVNSNTINGLAINELPPITKPPMRVLQEEIDGRDGDITTNLGYGAYDKVMTIGLFHTFDINQIIAFFNGSGTIVFSNEPDKKYNYKIIDQIDYEKLISFKTATVTFHCQPFKYPVEEEPIEVTYTYVEGEGETLTLNPTSEAPMEIDLKGNTSQNTTTQGKNLFNKNTITSGYRLDTSGVPNGEASNEFTSDFIEVESGETYIRNNGSVSAYTRTCFYDTSKTFVSKDDENQSFTIPNNVKYIRFSEYLSRLDTMQLEKGNVVTPYEPFTPNSPSPNYPSPVNVVTGDNEVVVCGKNILSGIEQGTLDSSGNPSSSTTAIRSKNFDSVIPNTQYTVSINGTATPINVAQYDSSKSFISFTYYNGTFTTSANTHYIKITKGGSVTDLFQVEVGDTATSYEPYQSQSYGINLGDSLPSNYTKVEYIQSSGTQYIDTNYKPTTNDRVECSMEYTTLSNQSIYGTYSGDVLEIFGNSGTNIWEYRDNTAWVSSTSSTSANTKYDVEFYYGRSNQYLKINNEVVASSTHSFTNVTSSINAYLFARNSYNSPEAKSSIKLYSMKIYSNEVLIRNFIPCYRNSDNEIGLYDLVNNTFYTNAGTGTFAKGNDIPNGIELCKIGDYQDYIYKDNGSWYLHKEIYKTILNGSENWGKTAIFYANNILSPIAMTNSECLSNYFRYSFNVSANNSIFIANQGTTIWVNSNEFETTSDFKTWLSNNNTIVYYILNTPINTIIEDTELIEQLDNMENAMSYKGQTNIMQVPYDKPFIIKARTMEGGSDEAIINNVGNTYAKPKIHIEGNGIVNVYLNGNQIFAVNVTDEVVIDSTNLEAYNPNTSALENRKVTGNIANLKLNQGNNKLRFSGNLTKATITDYVRYL